MPPPPTTIITHSPSSQPTVAQMPLAALLSALAFTCADLLTRSPLVAPRVSAFFAKARAESAAAGGGAGGESKRVTVHHRRRRRKREQPLVAVVEDAGIKLVGMLHVLLCLPLVVAVLSERGESSSSSLGGGGGGDPRLLLYSSTRTSRLLVSVSSGYFLWDIVSILIRTYVATTARGKREGRSVGGGVLAHGKEFFLLAPSSLFFPPPPLVFGSSRAVEKEKEKLFAQRKLTRTS